MTCTRCLTPAALLLMMITTACAPADDAATTDAAPADEAAASVETAAVTAPDDLVARSEAFTAAWNQDDATVLAELFTENATVIADDTATFNGRQEIQDGWLQPGLDAVSNLQVVEQTWEADGADFRSSGRVMYDYTSPEGDGHAGSRYESTWTRDADGQWRVSRMTTMAEPAM